MGEETACCVWLPIFRAVFSPGACGLVGGGA